MSSATNSSERSTATAPSSARKPQQTHKPGASETEADYLQRQANDAKAAVSKTMGLIGSELARGTSVGAWTGEHPWVALSAATVAGFMVASIVIPTKEQQALRKLEKLERALHPPPPERDRASHDGNGRDDDRRQKPGLLGSLLREMVRTGVPALSSALAAAIGGQAAAEKATSNDGTGGTGDTSTT